MSRHAVIVAASALFVDPYFEGVLGVFAHQAGASNKRLIKETDEGGKDKMMAVTKAFQSPPTGEAQQLFMLFPDAGQPVSALDGMAARLGEAFPHAAIVGVQGPFAEGEGGHWLMLPPEALELAAARSSVGVARLAELHDVTLDEAVAEALPMFFREVRACQRTYQVPPEATALLGVGEGATVALSAALCRGEPPVCARVTAIGSRYAPLDRRVPANLLIHLLHGKHNPAIHFSHTVRAAESLVRLDADITADVVPHETHELSTELEDWVLKRLQTQVPRHVWEAAMKQADEGEIKEDE